MTSVEEEKKLATLVRTMNKWGFGLTKNEILDRVQEYIIRNHLPSPSPNNRPGNTWFRNFKKRNSLYKETLKVTEWNRLNSRQIMPMSAFANLLGKAWESTKQEVITKGFKTTGIFDPGLSFPVNPECIDEGKFHPDKLKRYKLKKARSQVPGERQTPAISHGSTDQSNSLTTLDDNRLPVSTPIFSETNPQYQLDMHTQLTPTDNVQNQLHPLQIVVGSNDINSPSLVASDNLKNSQTRVSSAPPTDQVVSFETLLLRTVTPALTTAARKRKRIDVAEVITSEGYFKNFQQQQENIEQKKAKIVNIAKKSSGKGSSAKRSTALKPLQLRNQNDDVWKPSGTKIVHSATARVTRSRKYTTK